MKIYKLSDAIPEEGSKKSAEDNDGLGKLEPTLKITDIRQAVKNQNRVNIFVNGKYSFSLDIAQVVDLRIKVGREIAQEELDDFKKASEFGKAYQRALEWVLMRPRSERELRDYLKKREIRNDAKDKRREWEREREIADLVAKGEDIDAERLKKHLLKSKDKVKYDFNDLIVSRLIERGYVDDLKFAEYYVENRFVEKGISKKRLKMELFKKGISSEIIDKVLDIRNDEEEILKIISKKRDKYDNEKLINYLVRQGFSYQQVQNLVQNYGKD